MATYTDNYQLTKPTYAEQADIGVINSNMNIIDDVMHSSQISLAPAYDQSQTYAEGDVVMYELLMYKCISPTTGVWDASKWERTTASESGGGGSAELDILGEASGAVASFADGASAGLAKCIAEIVPKQAGSGTPSPSNVRAISGYTTVKVDVAGKNLCRVNTGNNVVVAHCKSGFTYTFSIRNQGNCGFNLKKNTTEGEQIVRQAPSTDTVLSQTFTADEDFDLFLNGFGSGGSSFGSSAYDYQLELGSDATTYEAYAGSTTTTTLGRTVYGGTLNVLTGELKITHGIVTIDGSGNVSSIADLGTNVRFWYAIGTGFETYPDNAEVYCNCMPCAPRNAQYQADQTEFRPFTQEHPSSGWFKLPKSLIGTTSTTIKQYLSNNNIVIVAPLATPQTVQLTPQEVNSLLGQNNISADTGDVDIVYVKASAPIQPNPTGTPTATLKKLGIEGTVFEVEGGGGGSSAVNYSTTEQVIGTWIDGKPLYQKTYEFGNVTGDSASFSLGLSDIDNIMISSESYFKSGGNNIPFPYTHPDANNMIGGFFGNSNSTLEVRVGVNMRGYVNNLTVTIQYTKITD